jgi:hypothetical protein
MNAEYARRKRPAPILARDGFPIDPGLERRARLATPGFLGLAGCYVIALGYRLAQLSWEGALELAYEIEAHALVLLGLTVRSVAGALLALASWHAISMRRWSSEAVVWLAGLYALWAAGAFGLAAWAAYRAEDASLLEAGLLGLLLAVHLGCFELLRRAVGSFNVHRWRVLSEREGLIRTDRPLGRERGGR